MKHHFSVDNKPIDALNHVIIKLHNMNTTVVGFNHLKNKYVTCLDFGTIFQDLQKGNHHYLVIFVIRDHYLFKSTNPCFPRTMVRDFLI